MTATPIPVNAPPTSPHQEVRVSISEKSPPHYEIDTAAGDHLPKPAVIPQSSRDPNVLELAYPPALEANAIAKADFLAFLQGLNDVFRSTTGKTNSKPMSSLVELLRSVLETALETTTAALDEKTTTTASAGPGRQHTVASYLESSNTSLFNPAGLQVRLCSTKEMLASVSSADGRQRDLLYGQDRKDTPHDDGTAPSLEVDLEALKEYTLPLELDHEAQRQAEEAPATLDALIKSLFDFSTQHSKDKKVKKQLGRAIASDLKPQVKDFKRQYELDKAGMKREWLAVKKEFTLAALKYATAWKLGELENQGEGEAKDGWCGWGKEKRGVYSEKGRQKQKDKVLKWYGEKVEKVERKMDKKLGGYAAGGFDGNEKRQDTSSTTAVMTEKEDAREKMWVVVDNL